MSVGTRIRYKKEEQKLVSPVYFAEGRMLRVIIDTTSMTVSVEESIDGAYSVVKVASATGLNHAKKVAKSELKALGVSFYEEARNRKSKEHSCEPCTGQCE